MSGADLLCIPYLPEPLIALICLRLPVKSLLRFRSVSKSWKSLIASPHFISHYNTHQQQQQQQQHSLAAETRTLLFDEEDKHYLSLWREEEPFEQRSRVEWPVKFPDQRFKPGIIGCCGGVFCCLHAIHAVGLHSVFVWNPSIRRWVQIPDEIGYGTNVGVGVGLGFDNVVDDYKVVSVMLRYNKESDEFEHEGKVYSVREDRVKSVAVLSSCIPRTNDYVVHFFNTVFMNGCVNWVLSIKCREDGGEIEELFYDDPEAHFGFYILRFDVHGEVVDAMPSPIDPVKGHCDVIVLLGEIKGCLALYNYLDDVNFEYIIWRMTEYGVCESWTKLHNVKIMNWGTSEMSMVITVDHEMESVSDETNSKKVLDSEPTVPASVRSRVDAYLFTYRPMLTYVESLGLIDGSNLPETEE